MDVLLSKPLMKSIHILEIIVLTSSLLQHAGQPSDNPDNLENQVRTTENAILGKSSRVNNN